MRLGCHVGVAGGIDKAPALGKRIGCESIQVFAKSPYMWKGVAISDSAAQGFRAGVRAEGLVTNAVHHGYLVNLAGPLAAGRKMSKIAFLDELGRAEKLGVDYLIFHPGAHMKTGVDAGIGRLVECLDELFDATEGYRVRALLENAAGQGSTVCSTFEELAEVLRRLKHPERAGVALDTCHLFAAGNDFRTEAGYGAMMDRIGATIGFDAVRAFHLNDAKAGPGSHLDRHENIGKGQLGAEAFGHLLRDPRWADRPGYLETPLAPKPNEYSAYEQDLATLRSLLEKPAPAPVRGKGGPRRASTPK